MHYLPFEEAHLVLLLKSLNDGSLSSRSKDSQMSIDVE